MTPGIIICPSCGMRLSIRPGRSLTTEERTASAWRPQHGPCVVVSRPSQNRAKGTRASRGFGPLPWSTP